MAKIFKFESEAEMMANFILYAEASGYDCYSETNDYDLYLVCKETGYQIGVEGKQSFNAKVIDQASIEKAYSSISPDFVCCLVPEGGKEDLISIANKLNVTIIRSKGKLIGNPELNQCKSVKYKGSTVQAFLPSLPNFKINNYWINNKWFDLCPIKRHSIPDYKPDVISGSKSPLKLTSWKIKAIKICCVLKTRGYVIPKDFKELKIHQSLWGQRGWIVKGKKRGEWIEGELPDFEKQHPVNYKEIFNDIDNWATGHLKELLS